MDIWIRLLGIDTPPNTVLQSTELSWRGLMPLWLALLIFFLSVPFVWWLYFLERGTLGWPRRIFLALTRTALIALLLFLLLRPVLLAEFAGENPRSVVLLLDNSKSLEQRDRRVADADRVRVAIAQGLLPPTTDPRNVKTQADLPPEVKADPTRVELLRLLLENKDLNLVPGLAAKGPVRPLLFGRRLHGLKESEGDAEDAQGRDILPRLLAGLQANETGTALADSLLDLVKKKAGDVPAAVVVFTDGLDNASKYTLQEAALEGIRRDVPIHLVGLGTSEGGLLRLKEVQTPDTIFVEDTLFVPIRWQAQGFKKGTVEVVLTLGGKVMAKKEMPVQVGDDLRQVLAFTVPKGKGEEEDLDLAATIRLKDDDQFRDEMKRSLRVVDRKIKVLYIEHSPRFEYKFLQAALLRDRRIEPTFLLKHASQKVAEGGPPFIPDLPPTREKFFDAKYNVIILGDVSPDFLGKKHLEWIKEWVENRGGLIVLSGRQHMPAAFVGTDLETMLPVEFSRVKKAVEVDVRTQEYSPTLTDVGLRTDMLALADAAEENQKVWQELPGFHWYYPVTKLRPGAFSLVVNPRAKMGEQPMPVVASQFYGKGQVLFLGTDETWRWRRNVESKLFVRFWGQVIYQMGLPTLLGNSAKRVQVALESSRAVLNQQGRVFVRLLDRNFEPRKEPQVQATLEYLDAPPGQDRSRKLVLHPVPGQPGEYSALLAHDRPGRWELKIADPENPTTFPFRVALPPRHELEEAGLPEKALRELDRLPGFHFYREEDLHRLAANLETRMEPFVLRQEKILWNPLLMLLFTGLITVEWVVRKFSNLS